MALVFSISIESEAAQPGPNRQDFLVTTWGAEDGLRNSTVNDIAQTEDGYLWFATYGGLARFDGIEFRLFNPNNTPELTTRSVALLATEPGGRLWVGLDGGVTLSGRGGKFCRWTIPDTGPGGMDQLVGLHPLAADSCLIYTRQGRTHRAGADSLAVDEGARLAIPKGAYLYSLSNDSNAWFSMKSTGGQVQLGHVRAGRFLPVKSQDGFMEFSVATSFPQRAGGIWVILSRNYSVGVLFFEIWAAT